MKQRVIVSLLCLVFVIIVLGIGFTWIGMQQTEQATEQLRVDLATAEAENSALGNSLAQVGTTAVAPTFITITQLVTQTQVVTQTDVVLAHQIAAQALTQLEDNYDLALLLSREASRIADTPTTRSTLLYTMRYNPTVKTILPGARWAESLEFSPDGRVLAAGYGGGIVELYDVATGQLIDEPDLDLSEETGEGGWVGVSVDFSPDGQWLAVANPSFGEGNHITIWDMVNQQTVASSEAYADYVAFAPDGKHLFSSLNDGVTYWEISADGLKEVNRLIYEDPDQYPLEITVSPSGVIAIGERNAGVTLWNPVTNETETVSDSEITPFGAGIQFSFDGNMLAFDSLGDIILWNMITGEQIGNPLEDAGEVVGFSPNGQRLLSSAYYDESLRLWLVDTQTSTGEPFDRWGRTRGPFAAAFSPDGKTLTSSYPGGQIILWDVTGSSHLGQEVGQVSGEIQAMSFTDEQQLAVQTREGEITFWDVFSKTQLTQTLTLPISDPRSFIFSQDYQLAATHIYTNNLSTIILSEPFTGQTIGQPITLTNYASSFAFSPDGTILAVGDDEGQLTLWDVATQELIDVPLPAHNRSILSTVFSPDGKVLATGGFYEVLLWDVETRQPLLPPISIEASVLKFIDDGRKLVTRDYLGNFYLWDTKTGGYLGEVTTGTGNWGQQQEIAFNPNGKFMATSNLGYIDYGRRFRTVTLLDAVTQQPIGGITPLMNHSIPVFSPDGSFLVTARTDQTIVLWDLRLESWQESACRTVNRNFTTEEWSLYFGSEPYRKTCPDLP